MKSSLKIIISSLLVLALLTACGNSSEKASTEPSVSTQPESPKVKLNFIHFRGEDVKAFDKLIKKFENDNPNITVEMQAFPSDQYNTVLQPKLLDGSSADVFAVFPGSQYEAVAKAGLFADLTGAPLLSNYVPSLIEAGQKDGKQLAVPYLLVYNIPIYNVKLFEKYNLTPAKDWEGFLALCEKFKQEGIIPIAFAGAGMGPAQFMNSMVMNNAPDPQIFDKLDAGETKLTDEWWVKTLTQFKELNDKGYFQKDAVGTKDEGASALFIQEKAAILATGSFQLVQNKQQNPQLEQKLLAPITVPAESAVFEGIHTTSFLLGVNAKSKHPDEAKKFLEFLSGKEEAGQYANETGQSSTVSNVLYDNELLKSITDEWTQKKTRFNPRYTIKNGDVQSAVLGSIQAVLGGKSPEKAASEAQAIVEQQTGNK
ncbi:ABC transporter substrate-binding protein [Cohnella abietis]|uniref:ABC transporter substrate-binding protein n=1 Tax=Cohnella abietis TaxID=2507935 RepID=UPI00102EB353|nr:extracellular solute-binding protein [Cohnella abietis]